MQWRIRRGADFLSRNWDEDEYLVYDATSGDTHLLNRVTFEVLQALEASPMGSEAVGLTVARALEIEAGPDFHTNISNLLAHLDQVGLVEPIL